MNKSSSIRTSNLSYKINNRTILDRVDIDVPSNGITFLLGRNGAGKTTLFSLLTRFYKVQRDSKIELFGLDLNKSSAAIFKKIGIVFQQRTLDLDLSVKQNLLYFAELHGLNRKQAIVKITNELQNFGLFDTLKRKVRVLSGGQIRRVELVRSLLNTPQLLLLDEPTSGLDIESRMQLTEHVRNLSKHNLAALWSTHLIDEINLDDYVIILEQGRVLAADYADKIIQSADTDNLQQAFIKLTGTDINAK